jgi:cysteinyl-tRNA synthetase
VFPHHTTERAEAIAAGRTFSRYWMHNAMLNIDGEKMSKSLNNFNTIQDVLDEHPLNDRALRLLLLQTHYRKTLEINAEVFAQARSAIERLDAMVRKADAANVDYASAELDAAAIAEFRKEMEDDFGTPEAMAIAFEIVRRANGAIDAGEESASSLVATAINLTGALGLHIGDTQQGGDDDAEIDALVAARTMAKDRKDFAEADRIRDDLAALGITIEDTPNGPIWRRS